MPNYYEARIDGLKDALEAKQARIDALEAERDEWKRRWEFCYELSGDERDRRVATLEAALGEAIDELWDRAVPIPNLGATTEDVQEFNELLDRLRSVQRGDHDA
jgi:predicted RNase H-like nuclease (RuvC/YqgF family)